jgi:hypothetical protein
VTERAPKHPWHLFDAERGLEVRQATNRLRANRWEVRERARGLQPAGRVAVLDDAAFDRLRSGGQWPPPEVM